jgi:pantetheine-phosphate adenylyltransferase
MSLPSRRGRESLGRFLDKYGWLDRARIIKLDDFYGPILTDQSVKALVSGPLVLERAEQAVRLREAKGLPPISLEVSPLVLASDGEPVNSTRIRRGEIDRSGVVIGGRVKA